MAKRMTVVFDDEDLYTAVKVEAARTGRHAKDLVAEAVRQWLEEQVDDKLRNELAEAKAEWERDGGVEAGEFFRKLRARKRAR